MGTLCQPKTEEKKDPDKTIYQIMKHENNLDKEIEKTNEKFNCKELENSQYSNYSTEILEKINNIRKNPKLYAAEIEDNIDNIDEIKEGENKTIIFNKGIKVLLHSGEPAFRNAANKLREIKEMDVLMLKNELKVPLPLSEQDIFDTNYLKNQIGMMRANTKIDGYFKDMIKSSDVSALLLMVDDDEINPGKRRELILCPDIKYIGINSGFVGNTFVAYFAFSR